MPFPQSLRAKAFGEWRRSGALAFLSLPWFLALSDKYKAFGERRRYGALAFLPLPWFLVLGDN